MLNLWSQLCKWFHKNEDMLVKTTPCLTWSPHRNMCATMEGPYQSPAFFPEPLPISTSWWTPKGAGGWSPNQVTSLWCMSSTWWSLAHSGLFFWLLGRDFSWVLDPRGEPNEGIGTPPARAGDRGRNTSKSTSVSCWASGQAQSTEIQKSLHLAQAEHLGYSFFPPVFSSQTLDALDNNKLARKHN